MATDASRFEAGWGEDPNTLYPDSEKHILAFDLPSIDDEVRQLDDAAGMHAVQLHVQRNHPVRTLKGIP